MLRIYLVEVRFGGARATLGKDSIIRHGIIGCECNEYVFEVRSRACSDRSITAYPAHIYSKYVLGLAVLHVMQALYASISRMVFRTSLRTVQDISTCFELWTFEQSAKITYSKRRDVLAVELCCRMFSRRLKVVRKVWVL